MRQVQDTLVWLAMILVVAGVLYVMPRVASLVAAAEKEHTAACVNCRDFAVSQNEPLTHRHDHD
jgi:hypothetical protein